MPWRQWAQARQGWEGALATRLPTGSSWAKASESTISPADSWPRTKGQLGHKVAVLAVQVVVQVRATDPGGADAHQHFVGVGLRWVDIGQAQVAWAV